MTATVQLTAVARAVVTATSAGVPWDSSATATWIPDATVSDPATVHDRTSRASPPSAMIVMAVPARTVNAALWESHSTSSHGGQPPIGAPEPASTASAAATRATTPARPFSQSAGSETRVR